MSSNELVAIGLALDLVGFWLILWDLVPGFLRDRKLRKLMSSRHALDEIERSLAALTSEYRANFQALNRTLAKVSGRALKPGSSRLPSAGLLAQARSRVSDAPDGVAKALDRVERATANYQAALERRLPSIAVTMKDFQVPWLQWRALEKRQYKTMRPLSKAYLEKLREVIGSLEEEVLTVAAQRELWRSPILLGALLVSFGFVLQIAGTLSS